MDIISQIKVEKVDLFDAFVWTVSKKVDNVGFCDKGMAAPKTSHLFVIMH